MQIYFFVWLMISLLFFYFAKGKINRDGSMTYNKGIVMLIGLIYVIFASFREVKINTSLDAYNYYYAFIMADMPFGEYIRQSNFELGYTIITWLFRQVSEVYVIQLFTLHTAIYYMYIYFLKHIKWNRNGLFSIAAMFLGLFTSFYLFRMYLAIGMGLILIVMLAKKKYGKALLCIFGAILLHNSALILIPVYVFNFLFDRRKRIDKWKIVLFTSSTLIITYILSSFLAAFMSNSDKYLYYQNDGTSALGLWGCMGIILLLTFFKFNKIIQLSSLTKTLVISLCANLLVIPLQLQYGIMYRMNLFFIPITLILLVELQNVYKKSCLFLFIRLFSILYCIYRIYFFFTQELQYIGVPYSLIG